MEEKMSFEELQEMVSICIDELVRLKQGRRPLSKISTVKTDLAQIIEKIDSRK